MEINEMTQSFRTKYERFIIGCDSIEEIDLWNKDEYGEMDVYYENEIVTIILRLITSDGKISDKEVKYLNEAFGFEYTIDELQFVYDDCCEYIDEEFEKGFIAGIEKIKTINEKLAGAYKELVLLICDIIAGSDGVITLSETNELKKIQSIINKA